MLDIKFVRSNPEVVKQNIKNKFQDSKLPLVDEVLELDQKNREIKGEVEALRAEKNKTSKQIGAMMAQGKKEEAEELKRKVTESADKMEALSAEEKEVEEKIKKIMMTIPNIIDPSVPIGKMTVKMWNWSALVSRLFLILKFHITQKLWKDSMESIWIVQEKWQETDFII